MDYQNIKVATQDKTTGSEFKEFEPRLGAVQSWLIHLEILTSVSRS